jgi:hypothetical protein
MDPTVFSAIRYHYQRTTEFLLDDKALVTFPEISNKDLQGFREIYGGSAFVCRYLHCVFSTDGFESTSQRAKHESQHQRRFRCAYSSCFSFSTGFVTRNLLNKHNERYHPAIVEGPSLAASLALPPREKQRAAPSPASRGINFMSSSGQMHQDLWDSTLESESFKSPPPPVDSNSRRKTVQVRPAALTSETLRNSPTVGTSIVPVVDRFRQVSEQAKGIDPDTVYESQLGTGSNSSPNTINNKRGRPTVTEGIQGNGTQSNISSSGRNHDLQDYQMQLMLLEQQNQKIERQKREVLMTVRQDQRSLILRIEGGQEIVLPWNVKTPVYIPLSFRHHAAMPQDIPGDIGYWGELLRWATSKPDITTETMKAFHYLQMMHYDQISSGSYKTQQGQTGDMYTSAPHSPGSFGGQQSDGAPSRPPSRTGNNRTPRGKIIDFTAEHAAG